MTILRNILAVVVGAVAGSAVNMALVISGHRIVPPPDGVDISDMEKLAAAMPMFGPQHFLFPFLAHALGTLLGATVAYLIAVQRRDVMAYVIGALFLAGGIYSVFALPAPTWFSVVDVLFAYLPMAWLGILLGKRLSGGSSP